MRMIAANGVGLHWREDGDPAGRPVVFANSLGTDLRLWEAVLPLLPKGLRLIRYDMRGHGLSDCPTAAYAMADLVDDAEALLDGLGITDCVFAGLSIGGMVAQGLAARRPDLIRALVLSNSAAKMGDAALWQARIDAIKAGGLEVMADAVMERWFSPAFRARPELALWRNMLTRTPVTGYLGCCHAIAGADLAASTRALTLPTLALAGGEDGASPPDLVRATAAMIPGSRFAVIEGAGHLPCVEAPGPYAALLDTFLKETAHVRPL
ncbi:MAG: 3-oxoadipate enol-lactonase [Rhodobacteraceae bacterium CG17_big_fil_post_rev_8_21_14_2_50_65_11]|nr:MAG: 3-oxoadipate enol-lactonase [Rhodobacteraceae bacterium CG17_big_fil_post_rev_8_21_14_2_50_65_11]